MVNGTEGFLTNHWSKILIFRVLDATVSNICGHILTAHFLKVYVSRLHEAGGGETRIDGLCYLKDTFPLP